MVKRAKNRYTGFGGSGIRLTEEPVPDLLVHSSEQERPQLYACHMFDKAHLVMLAEEGIIPLKDGALMLARLRKMEARGCREDPACRRRRHPLGRALPDQRARGGDRRQDPRRQELRGSRQGCGPGAPAEEPAGDHGSGQWSERGPARNGCHGRSKPSCRDTPTGSRRSL